MMTSLGAPMILPAECWKPSPRGRIDWREPLHPDFCPVARSGRLAGPSGSCRELINYCRKTRPEGTLTLATIRTHQNISSQYRCMAMRRAEKSSRRAARIRRPVPANQRAMAPPPKRAAPPLIEQFHVAVDRQLKSGYGSFEAANRAAQAIKKQYPQLQVTVYDAKERRHTTIEQPEASADPRGKFAHRLKGTSSQRRAVSGGGVER